MWIIPKRYDDRSRCLIRVKVHYDGTLVMNMDLLLNTWSNEDVLLAHLCRK